ncbi:MAG: hypothetical protein IPP66_13405 [Anaerolineales bacterium]|nr:hypothetical protein [Anaerolineales bacterium]
MNKKDALRRPLRLARGVEMIRVIPPVGKPMNKKDALRRPSKLARGVEGIRTPE